MNHHSSRSHTILIIKIENKQTHKMSQLFLVDLAGNEKSYLAKTKKEKEESKNINLSLNTLNKVVQAINEKRPHIPFRESKLTRVLQSSFTGSPNVSMIICCSPSELNKKESISSLDFGMNMLSLKIKKRTKTTNNDNHNASFWQNKYFDAQKHINEMQAELSKFYLNFCIYHMF